MRHDRLFTKLQESWKKIQLKENQPSETIYILDHKTDQLDRTEYNYWEDVIDAIEGFYGEEALLFDGKGEIDTALVHDMKSETLDVLVPLSNELSTDPHGNEIYYDAPRGYRKVATLIIQVPEKW